MIRRSRPRQSKYGAIKTEINGEKFDSKREAERWSELVLLQRAGVISGLRRQYVYVLAEKAVFTNSRASPEIKYLADFVYNQDGRTIVEDVKSEVTRKLPVYRLKRHLMKTVHGIEIKEVT